MIRIAAWCCAVLVATGACGECTGTGACGSAPEVSYSGQFIEHKSGRTVPGVRVTFVRQSGVQLAGQRIAAVSDAQGFFTLRGGASRAGVSRGRIEVTPPPPWVPYAVDDVTLATSTVRGAGGWLGRWVVNPYVLMVGVVQDRWSRERIPGATVVMRRTAGGRADSDTVTFRSDFGGQFSWEPTIAEPGDIEATFEITVNGRPRSYVVDRTVTVSHRDGDIVFIILPVGAGIAYSGTTARRGSGLQLPGVTIEWRRTGGIMTRPDGFLLTPDPFGSFPVPLEPLVDTGSVVGELHIVPPAPYPPEVLPLELRVSDDDVVEWLGFTGYGAQVFARTQLRFADTGEPLPEDTDVSLIRTGGVALDWPNPTPPQADRAVVADSGLLTIHAPTADSGTVTWDLVVRPPPPNAPDTLRGIALPSRYSDEVVVLPPLQVRRRASP